MPINAGVGYQKAEYEYENANTLEEKIAALKKMLSLAPNHKASQVLRAQIKQRIAKLKTLQEKQKHKKSGFSLGIKKEGAAQIVLVGTTNTGKSYLLHKLTNAKVEISPYPFTTKKPEIGILDYKGLKLQIIEIPSIVENFQETEQGHSLLSIIKQADLIILFFNEPSEKHMLDLELENINKPILIYNNQENIQDEIWKRLNIIKVYTKQPGKPKDFPPIAMKKGATVEELARHIHKDFINKFKFARIWGKSSKFGGMRCGLSHKLEDDDIVELHIS